MPKPFFSIVIPFYNRASTLGRAIASVQAQTYTHWELVLVDDASTDASVSIAAHASAQDSRIRVLTNAQNQERSLSRNRGIMAAQGRYICFLDSDDYHLPEHLSMLHKGLEKLGFPNAFLFTKAWNEDAQGNREERFCPDFETTEAYRYFILYTVNPQRWCVHSSVLHAVKFDPHIPICEDMDTTLRMVAKGIPMYELKERTTVYVAHPESFTWGDPQKWQRELNALTSIFDRRELRPFLPLSACNLRRSACHYHLAIESWKKKSAARFYRHAGLSFILCPKGYNRRTNKNLMILAVYNLPIIGSLVQKAVSKTKVVLG
jgi:glycosyltransferase involved in cell wall biosynthesis